MTTSTERQYWLLNPGPVNVSEGVKNAALRPDLCHREPEYAALMKGVRKKLLDVARVKEGEYKSVLIAGSGTAALELGISSMIRPGKKLLVLVNGVYGERIAKIAELHGIERKQIVAPWTERPNLDAADRALAEDPAIDAVALVHHETTTGLLNPVREVGALAKKHGRLFFLDSISAFGGEELDLAASGVDFMACTANKCLHGLPGVAFLLLTPRAEAHIAEVAPRSLYFDLKNYIAQEDANTIPFTPCVPGMYTLDRALDELLAEGMASRIATYRQRAAFLRKELRAVGLELYLDERLLSNTITTFKLPKGVTYPLLHDALKADGFVIYAGQGKLASEIFRVANMGHVPMSAYETLVKSVKKFIG
jgi:2-aminoethylphosphonate-pyruvate transaminase